MRYSGASTPDLVTTRLSALQLVRREEHAPALVEDVKGPENTRLCELTGFLDYLLRVAGCCAVTRSLNCLHFEYQDQEDCIQLYIGCMRRTAGLRHTRCVSVWKDGEGMAETRYLDASRFAL